MSPIGLLIVVLAVIATCVLVWSMNKAPQKLPETFDPAAEPPAADGAVNRPIPSRTANHLPTGRQVNRLTGSTQPYLRQHADKPGALWRSGRPRTGRAAQRDVPILLSIDTRRAIGVTSWRTRSFEDRLSRPSRTPILSASRVDREERPNSTPSYMNATVALTGQGRLAYDVLPDS